MIKREREMKNHTDMSSRGFLGSSAPVSLRAQKEEMRRLKEANQFITGVFGELHNIQELISLDKKIAEVENLEEKIKESLRQIQKKSKEYEQSEELQQGAAAKAGSDSIPLEAHPELQDMGGMPLEIDKLDKEFLEELGISDIQDKTEIENQLKDKLQNRLKLAAKLQNDLKAQPQNKPTMKQANELVIKYKEELKQRPALKFEMPAPAPTPAPAPQYTPKPRPQGM